MCSTSVINLFFFKAEIIEQCYAVSLGPNANGTGFFERLISGFDSNLAVKGDREFVAHKIHPQRMPLVGSDFHVNVLKRAAAAVDSMINRQVIFQRVGAGEFCQNQW